MNKQKLRFISIGFLLSAVLLAGFQLFYPEALPGSTFNGEATADSTDYQEKYESTLAELELQQQLNEAATSSAPAEGAAVASSAPAETASIAESSAAPARKHNGHVCHHFRTTDVRRHRQSGQRRTHYRSGCL